MTPTRPAILATDLVTLLGSPDPGLWVSADGYVQWAPRHSTQTPAPVVCWPGLRKMHEHSPPLRILCGGRKQGIVDLHC